MRWLFAVAFAASCAERTFVPMPALSPAAGSVLFVVEVAGEVEQVIASDTRGPVEIEWNDDNSLVALEYHCDVEALFGAVGPVEITADGTPLPRPVGAFSYDGVWSSGAEVPRVRLHLAYDVCARFDVDHIVVPDSLETHNALAMPIDEGWLVAITASVSERWYTLHRDGRLESFAVDTPTNVTFRGGQVDPDGTVWLFSSDGRLARLSRTGQIEFLPGVAPFAGFRSSLAPRIGETSGVGLVLAHLSRFEKVLMSLDGGVWEVIEHFPETPTQRFGEMHQGEGEVLILDTPRGEVFRYDGATARRTPVGIGAGLTAVDYTPGYGVIVGTEGGDLLSEGLTGFEAIEGDREVFSIIGMEPVDDGLMYGGQLSLAQHHPSVGFCGADTGVSQLKLMRASGLDVLLLTKDALITQTDVTLNIHRRSNPRPACLQANSTGD